ncbi:hypothetical protein HDU97_006503 [Phlyctochytrium planicorne]|nr:hypothetical protein HDU97_006503 [Phlyctochytrium planicorne]
MEREDVFIDPKSIEVDEAACLGQGGSGAVFKAIYANETVVIKRLKRKRLDQGSEHANSEESAFRKEARILATLNHPRIVRFLGVVVEQERMGIVLEYLPNGSLYEHYTKSHAFPLPSIQGRLMLASDVATGLQFLHSKNIVHGDVKSPNVLLYTDRENGGWRAKISDFGEGRLLQGATNEGTITRELQQGGRGTWLWLPPEIMSGEVQDTSLVSDTYSFGILLTEIFSWVGPYTVPISQLRFDLLSSHLLVNRAIPSFHYPLDVPTSLRELIIACTRFDPQQRLIMAQVVDMIKAAEKGEEDARGQMAGVGIDSIVFDVSATGVERGGSDRITSGGNMMFGPKGASVTSDGSRTNRNQVFTYQSSSLSPTKSLPSTPTEFTASTFFTKSRSNNMPAEPSPPSVLQSLNQKKGSALQAVPSEETLDLGKPTATNGNRKSLLPLWVILGLVVVGGISAGVYLGLRKDSGGSNSNSTNLNPNFPTNPTGPTVNPGSTQDGRFRLKSKKYGTCFTAGNGMTACGSSDDKQLFTLTTASYSPSLPATITNAVMLISSGECFGFDKNININLSNDKAFPALAGPCDASKFAYSPLMLVSVDGGDKSLIAFQYYLTEESGLLVPIKDLTGFNITFNTIPA